MAEPGETVVRWYLRFNGYLGVENLVVHEPMAGAVPQGTEFDVVGVRFPHSREIADFELPRHGQLTAIERADVVNVLVAEVKAGRNPSLNDVWRPEGDEALQVARLRYLVRWIGLHARDEDVDRVAADLRSIRASDCGCAFRAVYFGARSSPQAAALGMPQILFADIAAWIVDTRASSWRGRAIATRSCHDQWDPLIKSIWNLADPDLPGDSVAKVRAILAVVLGRSVP